MGRRPVTPAVNVEVDRLLALAEFCRSKGVIQLQIGDVSMVLGPDPAAHVPQEEKIEDMPPGALSLLYASSPASFDRG